MQQLLRSKRSGLTLIELIIVIAIIAIIAAAVFVAIDPVKRLHATRNAKRTTDITAILKAIKEYQADNGSLPATAVALDTASGSVQIIGSNVGTCGAVTCGTQTVAVTNCGLTSLEADLRPYLKIMPKDPVTGTTDSTRYFVNVDTYGIVSVGACDAEGEGAGGTGTAPTVEVTQ